MAYKGWKLYNTYKGWKYTQFRKLWILFNPPCKKTAHTFSETLGKIRSNTKGQFHTSLAAFVLVALKCSILFSIILYIFHLSRVFVISPLEFSRLLILDKFTLLSLSSSSFRYSLDIQHLSTDFFFASISLSTSPWSFVFLIDCFCCHVKVVNYISTFYVIIFLTTISALALSLVVRLISCTTCSSEKGVTAHSFQMMMPELKISDGST